jgi:hypothetical protein
MLTQKETFLMLCVSYPPTRPFDENSTLTSQFSIFNSQFKKMSIEELKTKLNAKELVASEKDREIKAFYAGDFLSRVMGRMEPDSAWFTIVDNVNVAGVAVLADAAAVVLCEGVMPDAALLAKAKQQCINLLATEMTVFAACCACGVS